MFHIVDFKAHHHSKEKTVVPDIWLSINNTLCALPPNASNKELEGMAQNRVEPGPGWQIFGMSLLKTFNTYSEARRELERSKESSQADEGPQRNARRKRGLPSEYSESDPISSPTTIFKTELLDLEELSENEWTPTSEVTISPVGTQKPSSGKELEIILHSKRGRKRKVNAKKNVSQTKQKDKKVVKQGKKRSTEMLCSFRKPQSVSSDGDSDSDDSIMPSKIHKEKISELNNSIKVLKEKNRILRETCRKPQSVSSESERDSGESVIPSEIHKEKVSELKNSIIVLKEKNRMLRGICRKPQSVSSESDRDSGDSVIPSKIYKEKISELNNSIKVLKEKNLTLKAENKRLEAKFDEAFNINVKLQKRLLEFIEVPILNSPHSLTVLSSIAPLPAASSIAPLSTASSPNSPSSPSSRRLQNKKKILALTADDEENEEEEEFYLDQSKLSQLTVRVKPGQPGDSMFVKNLASALFGDDVLMKSSVISCNAKKDSTAKPALCPKRLHYIKKLLRKRIDKENPPCPLEEKIKRLNKVNVIIAEKIVTLAKKFK